MRYRNCSLIAINASKTLKRNTWLILLSLILTVAVSDYIWVELLGSDQIVAELETEKEKESEEELREAESKENRHTYQNCNFLHLIGNLPSINTHSGFIKSGNSFKQHSENLKPKLTYPLSAVKNSLLILYL